MEESGRKWEVMRSMWEGLPEYYLGKLVEAAVSFPVMVDRGCFGVDGFDGLPGWIRYSGIYFCYLDSWVSLLDGLLDMDLDVRVSVCDGGYYLRMLVYGEDVIVHGVDEVELGFRFFCKVIDMHMKYGRPSLVELDELGESEILKTGSLMEVRMNVSMCGKLRNRYPEFVYDVYDGGFWFSCLEGELHVSEIAKDRSCIPYITGGGGILFGSPSYSRAEYKC